MSAGPYASPADPAVAAGGSVPMLALDDVHVYYGNIAAVKGLSLTVNEGEIVTLIGSNGAGKSTTLGTISGLLRPKHGTVTFLGKPLVGVKGHQIVKRGICQSPEGRRIFPRMTVDENLDLGAFLRSDKAEIALDRDRVLALFPRLAERLTQKAGTMSGAEQQMLAVGRALMGRPKLLLLDEPSMGLAPGPGRPHLRDHRPDPPAGHHDPAGRAAGGRPCLRPGVWLAEAVRPRFGARQGLRGRQRLPRRLSRPTAASGGTPVAKICGRAARSARRP
jgi:branched-chain amino acid transport system ATP-binding protein